MKLRLSSRDDNSNAPATRFAFRSVVYFISAKPEIGGGRKNVVIRNVFRAAKNRCGRQRYCYSRRSRSRPRHRSPLAQEAQGRARRAARVLETAVGEALGPAQWGGDRRSDQVDREQLESTISPDLASRFRLMACHRDLWWPTLKNCHPGMTV